MAFLCYNHIFVSMGLCCQTFPAMRKCVTHNYQVLRSSTSVLSYASYRCVLAGFAPNKNSGIISPYLRSRLKPAHFDCDVPFFTLYISRRYSKLCSSLTSGIMLVNMSWATWMWTFYQRGITLMFDDEHKSMNKCVCHNNTAVKFISESKIH